MVIPRMFLVFVVQAFFLYLISLVHSFHCAQHTASFGDAVKLTQSPLLLPGLSVLQLKTSLVRIFIFCEPNSRLMISWMAIALRTLSSVAW
jgi:hypothetical protein